MAPGGVLWFVFIGHGAPSADQDGMLVGVDAYQSAVGLYARSVPQRELLELAAAGKQGRSVFIVDACFSGRSSSGAALAKGLQPLLPVASPPRVKRALIFTAGTADQFAGPLPSLERPAFSYLMLGGLLGWGDANRDGVISSVERVDYAHDTLRAVLNGRNQSPPALPTSGRATGQERGRARARRRGDRPRPVRGSAPLMLGGLVLLVLLRARPRVTAEARGRGSHTKFSG